MLVVRRVDVDEIDVEERGELVRVEPRDGARRAGDGLREPQLELLEGPRRPPLQERHLQPGRTVDAIGRLEQGGEEATALDLGEVVAIDRSPDRVDPAAVVRLEVASLPAERLGEVAVVAFERFEVAQDPTEPSTVEPLVGHDVGLAERFRVGREIVRVHLDAKASKPLTDPGRAGEEIACRSDRQPLDDAPDQRHERPFRPDVLDHRLDPTRRAYPGAQMVSFGLSDDWLRLVGRSLC